MSETAQPLSKMQTLLQNSRISRYPKAYYQKLSTTSKMLANASEEELSYGSGGSRSPSKLITSPKEMARYIAKTQKRLNPSARQSKKKKELQ